MVATVPPTTSPKLPLATATLIAQSAMRLEKWGQHKRFWSCDQPDALVTDAFQQKILRAAFDTLIRHEADNLQYLLQVAIKEQGDLARQRKAATKNESSAA